MKRTSSINYSIQARNGWRGLLLLLANFGKEATVEPIIGKFSQETLAEMIGTTRSRVSFFMNKFRKLGYIEYNGKLEIRNSLLNVVLYDKPEIRKNDGSKDRDSFGRVAVARSCLMVPILRSGQSHGHPAKTNR